MENGGTTVAGAGRAEEAEGGSGGVTVSGKCRGDSDCPPAECSSCRGAPGGCPPSNCVEGQCFAPNCASVDACAQKSCGDACSACYSDDGSCSAGTCDRWGDCKETVDSCDLSAPRPCTRTDARGAGFVNGRTCNVVQGWGWNGSRCVAVVGCTCEGSDCRSLLQTETDCSGAFVHCRQ